MSTPRVPIRYLVMVAVLLVPLSARAADQADAAALPAGDGILGHRGLLRVVAASNQPRGTISIGTTIEFFTASEIVALGGGQKADHSRVSNAYSIAWAPFRFLEAAFALQTISNNTKTPVAEEVQVAVGDPEISIKGGWVLPAGFAAGALIDLRFPSAAGFFEFSSGSLSMLLAALGSWQATGIPLSVHINAGFLLDKSENLFDNPAGLSPAQLFAAQLSSFNRIVLRAGAEYATRYVGPFLEASMEPFIGSGAPSFGDSPSRLSLGARGWLGKRKALQLMAAVDVGLTGVADGEPSQLAAGQYAPVIPRWNLAFRLSYRFDPTFQATTTITERVDAPPPPPVVETARVAISGQVLETGTDKPVWQARVGVAGHDASALAVNPQDGTFRSFDLPPGKITLIASSPGYEDARVDVELNEEGAETTVYLTPKTKITPGTIRGIVSARGGAPIAGATVLIPRIDRALKADARGTFSVDLQPGEYDVVVSARRYRTQRKKIRVFEGSTVILNVELYK